MEFIPIWLASFVVRFLPVPYFGITPKNKWANFFRGPTYASFYQDCKNEVIDWHKRQLSQLGYQFAHQQVNFALARDQRLAIKKGIGPLDPRFPKSEDYFGGGSDQPRGWIS